MRKTRDVVKKVNKGFLLLFIISTGVCLVSGIELFITDELSVLCWTSMWSMLGTCALFWITFFIKVALPKDNKVNIIEEAPTIESSINASNYVQRDIKRYELERKINEDRARSYSRMRLQDSLNTTRNPVKKRAGWLNDRMRIPNGFCGPVSNIVVLESREKDGRKLRSYLLVLGKRYKYVEGTGQVAYSLEERTRAFDDFLKNNLIDGETLTYEHEAFCIKSDDYEIDYYIEAYRKQPDKKCYMLNGEPKVELLHRSGAARAFYDLKHHFGPHSDIIEKVFNEMNELDYVLIQPNAADRFVALCDKYKKIYQDT